MIWPDILLPYTIHLQKNTNILCCWRMIQIHKSPYVIPLGNHASITRSSSGPPLITGIFMRQITYPYGTEIQEFEVIYGTQKEWHSLSNHLQEQPIFPNSKSIKHISPPMREKDCSTGANMSNFPILIKESKSIGHLISMAVIPH